MFKEEKEVEMPIIPINATAGLVSVLQLLDTTSSEIFAAIREDTSEVETQRIIYPIELQKEAVNTTSSVEI